MSRVSTLIDDCQTSLQGRGWFAGMQAIALVAFLLEERQVRSPFLIAAPAAVLDNWGKELRLWLPTLRWTFYRGSASERSSIFNQQASSLMSSEASRWAVYLLCLSLPSKLTSMSHSYQSVQFRLPVCHTID